MSVLPRPVPWALASVGSLALLGASIVTATSSQSLDWSEVVVVALLAALVGGAGLFLAVREAAARVVGGILLVLGTVLAVDLLLDAAVASHDRGAATATAWRLVASLASLEWIATFALLATLAFVFPDGRPSRPVFARILRLSVAPYALIVAGHLLDARPNDGDRADIPGAVGVPGAVVPISIGLVGALLVFAAAVVSMVVRYRRSRGSERLQVLWLAWSIGLVPVTVVACVAASAVADRAREAIVGALFFTSVAAIVGSVVVAVTRHGLYAVERVVNRTVVYVALSGLLGGAWGVLVLIGGVLGGRGSPWVTAIATLVAASAFGPLRRRVQAVVDRRFDKRRLAAVAQIAAFSDEVRDGTAEPEAIGLVLRGALGDPTATLVVHGSDAAGDTDRLPPPDAVTGDAVTPVVWDGREVGAVRHDARLLERPALLRAVLAAAAPTVEIVRLREEVRVQLHEVADSRARLVRAGFEERRRIERDLHDGAQQRLVTLGIVLRRMQRSLPEGAGVLAPALDAAVDEVARAITDLRTIAAGIRPARLDEGLGSALVDLARTVPLPVDVDVAVTDVPAPLEEAAYFVVCEAVTNAVKHGRASRVAVSASRTEDLLRLSVEDDGIGGAAPRRGSGLVGLADRVRAHGGTISIDSPPGGGTRVAVEIPCAS